MSTRGVLAALAAISGVTASLILPQVSQAQLAETMTTTNIQGQLHTIPRSGLAGPGKAKAVAARANRQRAEDAHVTQDDPAAGHSASLAPPFDAKRPVKGQAYSTDGIVVHDGELLGERVVFLVRIDGPNKFQFLGFRLKDPTLPRLPEKAVVNVTATYAAKIKEPKTGSMVHGFDDAVFSLSDGQVAQQNGTNPAADQPVAEKPRFESVLKGWVFRGSAQVSGKATGVFVNDKVVKYVHAGEELSEGVVVRNVSIGHACVAVDNHTVDVMPW